jgi:hypothetical protein
MTDAGGDLFKFASLDFASKGTPALEPPTNAGLAAGASSNHVAAGSSSFFQINVIDNFQWTTSPKSSRADTPSIQLVEKRLQTNSLVAQALYNVASVKGNVKNIGEAFAGLPGAVQTAFKAVGGVAAANKILDGAAPGSSIGKVFTTLLGAGVGASIPEGAIGSAIDTTANLIQQSIKTISNADSIPNLNSTVLQPYEGLYITKPTNFIYTLPYFSDTQNRVSNQFQDNDAVFEGGSESTATPAVEGLTQAILASRGFAQGLARTAFFGAPGVYIEKPKYYNFNNVGEKISVRFPLVNTGWATFNDVMRNWQLLFMLTYQNRPNRKSRDLIDPSVLYEVNIPGIKYHPFAYIDGLIIRFRGSRRKMTINIPGPNGGSAKVTTIIPDAYDVELSLQTLINESQNTLYSMLFEKNDLISVTESGAGTGGSLPVPGGNLPLPNQGGRLPVQVPTNVPTAGARLSPSTFSGPEISAPARG